MRPFLTIAIFFLAFTAIAQPGRRDYTISDKKSIKLYESATAAYDMRNLNEAVLLLNNAIDRSPDFIEALILLGQAESERGNNAAAIDALKASMAIDPSFFPTTYYFLGELELAEARYADAQVDFQHFLRVRKERDITWQRAQLGQASCAFALEAMNNPVPFDPVNLGRGVNSSNAEYYPCLTVDGQEILFTREEANPNSAEGRDENFYTARLGEDGWSEAVPIPSVNTFMREGAPSLSPDGQLLIFTACEMFGQWGPDRQGYGSCDLFVSTRSGGEWLPPDNLGSAVNSRQWESQPSFASDGRTLYFVRGRRSATGINEQDIYQSVLQDDGTWSKAVPIKGAVNTPFEEESVQVHPDGQTLYFSSNGHPGMGGLDLFVSKKQPDGTWGEPVNLGYPINTAANENSLLVSAQGNIAIFASDRAEGQGKLDLYAFDLPAAVRPETVTYTRGLVLDAKSFKKLGARFELIDLTTGERVVESYSDDRTGSFLVPLPVGREYALNVSRPDYLFYSGHFTPEATADGEPYELEVLLSKIQPNSKATLNNIFFSTGKFDLLPASTVELEKLREFLEINPTVRVAILGHTDNVGSPADNQLLSENRAKAVVEYLTVQGISQDRLEAEGFGETQPIADNETESGRAKNRRTEFVIRSK